LLLDEALDALGRGSPREAEVLQMQFFGEFDLAEIAKALGVSLRTVERDSQFARDWLRVFPSPKGAS
jgi:RNA polymerase sigma factor (sigma-70 family)